MPGIEVTQERSSPVLHADVDKETNEPTPVPQGLDGYKRLLSGRYRGMADALSSGRYRRAMASTRALVVAEAMGVFMLGFILDDLEVLRIPGFLVGVVGAVAVLGLAGLPQGVWVARRIRGLPPREEDDFLARVRATGRILVLLGVVLAVAFLIVTASGVPPWT